ncbi:hypothetical protein GCM10009090_15810 [[Pseudomonas] boreopolis]|uniref:Short chain dehydrogenase n=2 Tax=Xanthomonas boreopolis TaxID=86183 RepID=A0A919KI46_9XANT|nr:hypothetical protein GCM10009090_15810 [[Pseudomonas] boreopolis]
MFNVVAGIEKLGCRGRAYRADSADAAALRSAIDRAAADLGRIDILVNNAGVLVAGDVAGFALEDFDRTMAVNLRAVFVATQAVLPHMREGGNIAGLVAWLASEEGRYANGASYALDGGINA